MFSDLECDYINPIDLCNKLNQVWGECSTSWGELTTCNPSLFCQKTLLMLFLRSSSCSRVNGLHSCSIFLSSSIMPTSMFLDHVFGHPVHIFQDTKQEPHVRRHRDIPHSLWTQERKLYKTRLLPLIFLLLPVPVRIPPPFTHPALIPKLV